MFMENFEKGFTMYKNQNNIFYLTSPLLSNIGIKHAFTCRFGGVSCGDFDSLNVSTRRKDRNGSFDKYENTVENFRRALSLVGAVPETSVCANQVHGKDIIKVDKAYAGMGILKGSEKYEDSDGLLLCADEKNISAVCVKSADCVPILLADKKTRSVCAVHSGWRGTCKNIVGAAIEEMLKNGSSAENIYCAIGPCIGECCYEVSYDVYSEAENTLKSFGKQAEISQFFTLTNAFAEKEQNKYHFDIGKLCAYLAYLSGLPRENIDFPNVCTCCTENEKGRLFFSHRRQGGFSGTQASVITNI